MERELEMFIEFIRNEKNMSLNTELSYKRDLMKLCRFEEEHGIIKASQINSTNLTSFILDLESKGFSNATISRTIASTKMFVAFLVENKILKEDVSVVLKAPKVIKKEQKTLSAEEICLLLEQPDITTNKGIRDKAMLELLYSSGLRVTQLIELKLDDINLKLGYVRCGQQTFPIEKNALMTLTKYITQARESFIKNDNDGLLFYNCSGSDMSRQGFWKMLKGYAATAGIKSDITPHVVRNSMR